MTGHLIVLGGTGCIGGSVVAAALEANRPVIAVARDGDALDALQARHVGAPLLTLAASIASDADAGALATRLRALGTPVTGVVAAVRGDIERGRLLDGPADFLRRRLDEDLLPHLFGARHLMPLLAEQRDDVQRGTYVLVGGPGADQPWAGYGHYSIGAAALRMLARVLKDEARALSVRVQLLAVESPARTAGNARHACSAWPDASAIARRALALVDKRVPHHDAVVRFNGHHAPTALWSDDIDSDEIRAVGPRAAARESDGAADVATQRSYQDARALLRAITHSPASGTSPAMNTRKVLARSGTPRSRAYVPLASLALAALIAAFVASCSSEAAPTAGAPPPPDVSVARVLSKNVRQWDDFSGRVAAVETVELRPRVSGYVDRVVYREGDEVKKGDLLFSIDPRPYRATLARAQAQLESARSEARLASAQGDRAKSLIEAKAISREEFETRNAANAQGGAGVRAAEAAVASAQLDLQFTQVRSPIDGRAGRAMITAGNLAQADATLLTTVVSVDPVHVYFDSDEQSFLRYEALARNGDRAASNNAVRVGLANETGYPHAGTLDFTDNQVDPASGTIRARAVLPNADHALTPGMFARVQLEGSREAKAMLIDDKAVLTDQDRKYVYVLGPKDTAQRKDVVLGRVADGLRVVEQGLAPQDKVIVAGVQKIFMPGMPVKPKTVAMDAPADDAKVAQR